MSLSCPQAGVRCTPQASWKDDQRVCCVLKSLILGPNGNPPGDSELQDAVSGPTPALSFRDPRAYPSSPPAINLHPFFFLGQWIFLITATNVFLSNTLYLELIVIWTRLWYKQPMFSSPKLTLLCLSSECQGICPELLSQFTLIPSLATASSPVTPFIINTSNPQSQRRPGLILGVLLGLEMGNSTWVPSLKCKQMWYGSTMKGEFLWGAWPGILQELFTLLQVDLWL